MDTQPRWLIHLWSELDTREPVDRIKAAGDWTVYLTHHVLPALGAYRRRTVVDLLTEPGWDARRIAETIGTTSQVIDRLAKDGRKLRHGDS